MATTAPTRRERVLAWGLLLAVLGLIHAGVIHPLWMGPMADANRRIGDLQEREHRIQTQLAQASLIGQRLQATGDALAARPGFIAEPSAELASAALVKRVEEAVLAADPEGRSCAVSNRSPLPQEAEAGRFLRISVRAHLRCGVPELSSVLHALESGKPRLFVGNLNLLAQRDGSGQGQGGGLEASFDVSGYLDPGGTAGDRAEDGNAP